MDGPVEAHVRPSSPVAYPPAPRLNQKLEINDSSDLAVQENSKQVQPAARLSRPIPKHLRTVTAAAIAHYGLDGNEQPVLADAAADFFEPRPYDAKTLLTGVVQKPKKKTSKKRQPPPPAKLLDPEQMARRMRKQDRTLVFGTSSQLAGPESPETLRAMHASRREPEAGLGLDDAPELSVIAVNAMSRPGSRVLWESARRDETEATYDPGPRAARDEDFALIDDVDLDEEQEEEEKVCVERQASSEKGKYLKLGNGLQKSKAKLLCSDMEPLPTPFSNQQRAYSTSASARRSPKKQKQAASAAAGEIKGKATTAGTTSKSRKLKSAVQDSSTVKRRRGRPKKEDREGSPQVKNAGRKTKAERTSDEPVVKTGIEVRDTTNDIEAIDDHHPPPPSPPRSWPCYPPALSVVEGNADIDAAGGDVLSAVNAHAAALAASRIDSANPGTKLKSRSKAGKGKVSEETSLSGAGNRRLKAEEAAKKRAEHKEKQNEQVAILSPAITRAVEAQPRSANALQKRECWYEKMIMYEPIVLEDFTLWLNRGSLHSLGGRTIEQDESMERALGVGEKGVMRLGERGWKANGEEIEAGQGLTGRLMPWAVQRWCEANSVCCVYLEGVWGAGRERKRI